ncbi:MAG: hypothetical protein KGS09_05480 [Nitrospirae bacterium]|nr:hypothetical protein [Nitrospirota bacterium]
MNDHNLRPLESSRKTAGLWPQFLVGAIGLGMVLAGLPARASDSQTPWECSSYTGAAHTRCLETFIESQRDQIAALQGKLQAQQGAVDHLKDQVDHQASASADLQRRLAQPPAVVQGAPPLYTYSPYAYPPVGLGLYLGRPWIYGPPYLYRPYIYGPRYYGSRHRGHRW